MDAFLTTRQLQDLLQVDRITIYRMLNDGRLQGFKVGGQWRFSRHSIEDWLKRQQTLPDAAVPELLSKADTLQNPEGGFATTSEVLKGAGSLQPTPEVLPLSCVQAVQDILAEALGVGVVTTSVAGAPLTLLSNSCEFCNLIVGTEAGRQRCMASWQTPLHPAEYTIIEGDHLPSGGQITSTDRRGRGTLRTQYSSPPRKRYSAEAAQEDHTPLLTRCHAGLCYAGGQVKVQGKLVAIVHIGQFLDKPPEGQTWSVAIQDLSAATGIDGGKLWGGLASLPVLDQCRIGRIPHLVERVAATFSEFGEERLQLLGRLKRIAEISSL